MKPNPTFPLSNFPTFQLLLFAALPVLAMDGNRNAADGTGAGHEATGDFTTAAGQYAAAWATNAESSAFLGYRSGSVSKGAENCIGIGAYALDGSASCRGVVAVGSAALRGAQAVTNATYINNQFVAAEQSDMFYISPSPTNLPAAAPIYYRNGTLYLNAPQIVTRSGVIGSTQGGSSAGTTNAYDYACYVSAQGGSDANDGLSPMTPFLTLDRAIAAATNGTVCVMAGTYAYPAAYGGKTASVGYWTDFVAPAGPSFTIISITNSTNLGVIHAPVANGMSSFNGFTFSNCGFSFGHEGKPTGVFCGVFHVSWYENCRFVMDGTFPAEHVNRYSIWNFCILSNCDIVGSIRSDNSDRNYGGDTVFAVGNVIIRGLFHESSLKFCTIDLLTAGGSGDPPYFGGCNHVTNCFMRFGPLWSPGKFYTGVYSKPIGGEQSAMYDSTFLVESYVSDYINDTKLIGSGNIVGADTNGVLAARCEELVDSVNTSYSAVTNALGSDRRCRSPASWFFKGYNSASDREKMLLYRDAIKSEIIEELSAQPTTTD